MSKSVSGRASHKVCVVTGSRADYGLLYFLMRQLLADPLFDLSIVATGMHLSPEFGMTAKVIEADGFKIAARVETLLSSDSGVGVAKATGLGVLGLADAFQQLRPDLLIILGDRFEIFSAAQAALFLRIPVAHIGGGDVTTGAFDDAIRHSISKLSHLHFVTNADAAKRLARMGENPKHIFDVGSPGLDHLLHTQLPSREQLEDDLEFKLRKRNLLVTFHPVTLDLMSSRLQIDALLEALSRRCPEDGIILTLPNADTEGRALIDEIRRFAVGKDNVRVFASLGQKRYLGVLALANVVVGNSSSGLYEAPSLGTPTVNIGNRQDGRLRADSVFDCEPDAEAIHDAIDRALTFGKQVVKNPYQKGDCAQSIVEQLQKVDDFSRLIVKVFHPQPSAAC
ncbi:UDP-N-acetylglucosamine 2-epimerase [Bradyrhizobium erythrophlei]|uniref:UDP-N-acetylglucosamine 2-epimerase (Non-hydrolysing)/GDP/UDP-N,N'-diacetylbacillosamine 2-epimerase (Hydrolysing) n=1 Tax=Bradyrhizobium erythrophlei TaxID=1437360 RepID=A0A1M7UH88_9BRAD|nr:UDP-N-acetylglucosamine 2-epimerase [Bradyrhizobium erythrophlei]SHN82391.1 UDP-N-acetylglucosamine 2-epimerase (non-hydrolysing)/GDP/UDP-N,N'-diacetylbacillosamine 2-epimerase (hydrolysing) [Bradyrhizobium erythrophlei]